MAHQELRYVPNAVPDWDAFVVSLRQQSPPNEEGQPPSFLSTAECVRLKTAMRSWLLQSVQLVMKVWPPSSTQSPTSMRGQAEQDYSIYLGTGKHRSIGITDSVQYSGTQITI